MRREEVYWCCIWSYQRVIFRWLIRGVTFNSKHRRLDFCRLLQLWSICHHLFPQHKTGFVHLQLQLPYFILPCWECFLNHISFVTLKSSASLQPWEEDCSYGLTTMTSFAKSISRLLAFVGTAVHPRIVFSFFSSALCWNFTYYFVASTRLIVVPAKNERLVMLEKVCSGRRRRRIGIFPEADS